MGKRISVDNVYENRFYRIPKAFFKAEKYKKLSLYAKVLYGFLDDRRELSLKNNWIDADRNIYLIFTRKEIQEMLCVSDKPVTKAFKELSNAGLIEEIRQGLNKPNIIYVCSIDYENIENMRTRKMSDSEVGENTIPESENFRCNDTEFNHTEFNDTKSSSSTEKSDNVLNEDEDKSEGHNVALKSIIKHCQNCEFKLKEKDIRLLLVSYNSKQIKGAITKAIATGTNINNTFGYIAQVLSDSDTEKVKKKGLKDTGTGFNNFEGRQYTDEEQKAIERKLLGWDD